jgi:hypothetical protein
MKGLGVLVVGAWRCGQREMKRWEEGWNASTCLGGLRSRRRSKRQDAARQAIHGVILAGLQTALYPVCGDEMWELGMCVKAEVAEVR